MNGIKFQATYKGKTANVEVSSPSGGNGSFHVMIDRYYLGRVMERPEGWAVVTQNEGTLTDQQKEGILRRLREAGLIYKTL